MSAWILTPDKFINEEEAKKLVKVCTEATERAELKGYWLAIRDWMVIDLVLNTGLRVQEVADLKVSDLFLNYNESTLIVQNGKGGIQAVTKAQGSIPGEPTWGFSFLPEGWPREKPKAMNIIYIDYNFAEVLGLEIIEGRDISKSFRTDELSGFLLNEAAVKELEWENNAVGKKIEYYGAGSARIEKSGQVVGVVRNFHFESFHKKVQPLIFTVIRPLQGNILIKLNSDMNSAQITAVIENIEEKWDKFSPEWPLELSFLDMSIEKMYYSEKRLSLIIQYFTALSLLITCLGLFALVSCSVEQRKKEICIRKVLGASIANVLKEHLNEFLTPVGLALILAFPIGYLAISQWLQMFAYRINISPFNLIGVGLLSLIITFITISGQTVKAAFANPVDSLRNE